MQERVRDFFHENESIQYDSEGRQTQDVDWILNHSQIPYLRLQLQDVPYQTMLTEARSLDDLYVAHRDSETHRGWSSLCIHGITSQHTQHYNAYPEYADLEEESISYDWTEIKDRCPATVAYFRDRFPYEFYTRLRFMRVDPGGYIAPHHDHDRVCLAPINMSLNNPKGCRFVFRGVGVVPFSDQGSAFLIAVGIDHSVWNQSHEPRYHIIVHGRPNRRDGSFDQLVLDSYRAARS